MSPGRCSGDSRGKPDWHRVCTGTDWLWRRVSQLAAIRRLPGAAENDSLTAAICTSTPSAFGRNAPSQSEPSAAGTASLRSARACDQAEISIRKSGVPAGFLLRCRASFLFCTQAKSVFRSFGSYQHARQRGTRQSGRLAIRLLSSRHVNGDGDSLPLL